MNSEQILSEKAKHWNFNVNLISEEDKTHCLRIFHGDWYEKMDDEDKYGPQAMAYLELNALITNGLLKRAVEPVIFNGKEERNLFTVLTHKGLEVPQAIIDYYLAVDGESDYEMVERDENEEVQERLKKYKFW